MWKLANIKPYKYKLLKKACYLFRFNCCLVVFFMLYNFLVEHSVSQVGKPYQTPRSVTSDVGLHSLPLLNLHLHDLAINGWIIVS